MSLRVVDIDRTDDVAAVNDVIDEVRKAVDEHGAISLVTMAILPGGDVLWGQHLPGRMGDVWKLVGVLESLKATLLARSSGQLREAIRDVALDGP